VSRDFNYFNMAMRREVNMTVSVNILNIVQSVD